MSELVAAVTVTAPFPVPAAGLKVSQLALSPADQLRVPPPALLMLNVCAAGLPPPCWPVNDRLAGLSPMAGWTGAAVIVSDTGTVTVGAPVAASEIDPL